MFKANGTKAKIVTPPLEMKYGCGIGPKMAMITPTILAVVNQSPSVRQFYLCYFDWLYYLFNLLSFMVLKVTADG